MLSGKLTFVESDLMKQRLMLIPLCVVLAGFVLPAVAQSESQVKTFPIGLAYAGDGVNAGIFRVSSVLSANGRQFATYYDADGNIVVASRKLGQGDWDIAVEPFKGNVKDAHDDVVLGVSTDGLLHISYGHHNVPLRYRVTARLYDIRSFGDERPMTGQNENKLTYPQFLSAPDGTLYFFYRDGSSGNGNLCINRYDASSKNWQVVAHPLIDGENKCNPYVWRPSFGPDGSLHLAWCWRDTPAAQTNHDLCYARSSDGGKTWLRSDGTPQPLPITPENAQVVIHIAKGSNLINQCSTAVDADGHPHLAQYYNDANGIVQFYHVWFDGSAWHQNQVSHRTQKFTLGGGGSLAIPISRPEIAISRSGAVYLIVRDAEYGNGIRLYRATAPFENWQAIDISHADMGNWEPTYDPVRLQADGILSLFVLPVQQGNHETTTDFAPQTATIMEMPLP
jgi:hypothetical protein